MMTSEKRPAKHNDKHNRNAHNDDDVHLLLPRLFSSIDEINEHLQQQQQRINYDTNPPITDIKTTDQDNNIMSANYDDNKKQKMPHLFLHFDVNETILLGDKAGGDTVRECLNKIIAKSAFVSTCGMDDQLQHSHEEDDEMNFNDADAMKERTTMIKRTPSSGNISDTHQFEPTHWWNGMSIDVNSNDETLPSAPPLYTGWIYPPKACPYYRTKYKHYAKKFTSSSSHGQIYRPLYNKLCQKMGLVDFTSDDEDDNSGDNDEKSEMGVFQNFLPAFWQTLAYYFPSSTSSSAKTDVVISKEEVTASTASEARGGKRREKLPPPPKVTLVLRTFGTDLSRVVTAISEFARGNHPDYPNYRNDGLIIKEDDLYYSGWSYVTKYDRNDNNDKEEEEEEEEEKKKKKKELVYSLYRANDMNENEGRSPPPPAYSGDDDILNLLESKFIVGIQDNYPFWSDNNHTPFAGKPVWANTQAHGHCHHHILLDDNIHNDPTDGAGGIRIPAVMKGGDGKGGSDKNSNNNNCYNHYESLNGEETLALHGRHLIRVPTIRPSLEDDWFIKQIETARLEEWKRLGEQQLR